MKRRVWYPLYIVVLVLCLLCSALIVIAEDAIPEEYGNYDGQKTGRVTTDAGLILRTGPGQSYTPIITLPEDTIVYYEYVYHSDMNWAYVSYGGYSGWVSLSYVEEVVPETETTTVPETTEATTAEPDTTEDYEPEKSSELITESYTEELTTGVSRDRNTGDNSGVIIIAVILLLFFIAIVVTVVLLTMKNKNNQENEEEWPEMVNDKVGSDVHSGNNSDNSYSQDDSNVETNELFGEEKTTYIDSSKALNAYTGIDGIVCKNCGTVLPPDATFCIHCGSRL